MESNIIKAIRELSSRTDTNIANTRRELISQMAKSHRELDSKVAGTQRELESKMADNHQELKDEVESQGGKLDGIELTLWILLPMSIVCIMCLQATSNLMLISTS